jgi:tricarballylate dehydrogenase
MPDDGVLVIGGGLAGLCAAIAARRLGVSVRLLENAPPALRGGNARHARNFRIAHAKPVWHTPGAYPPEDFLAELKKIAAPCPNEDLARALVEDSQTCAEWLMGCGVRLQAPDAGVRPFSRRTAFLLGGGKAMINALYAEAARLGVALEYDSDVLALAPTPEGWKAEIATAGARRRTRTRAIVVASGGPGGDPAWRREHFGENADEILLRGSPWSNGRLMRKLIESGAQTLGDPTSRHMVAVDARGPATDGGIVTRITAIPHGLVIDRNAERINLSGAGAGKTHYAQWGQKIAQCEGGAAFLLLDANAILRAPPAALAPIRADTLKTLAATLNLDAPALAKTVETFNREALHPIAAPPFFAFPLRAGLTFVHFGLAVDARLRVKTRDGAHKNLFAAGMIMAPNIFARGYLAGLGLTLSAVTGRRAGEAAARHVLA